MTGGRFLHESSRPVMAGGVVVSRPGRVQAARTELRNFSTSTLRFLLSCASDCADTSTCDEAEPVWLAPLLTSTMLLATCEVPCAACCTLREISWVAAP